MGTTTVVSLRTKEPYDVRIDRKTPWGNPYRVEEIRSLFGGEIITEETARDMAISSFRVWVGGASPKAVWIREHVHELRGKRLACWCAPLPCHGDVLAAMAEAAS